jgi:DNA topoisomerase-1
MNGRRFTLTERRLLDPGWTAVQREELVSFQPSAISRLKPGDRLKAKGARVSRCAPALYHMTEAQLIAALKAHGIGRPATYALVVESLVEHGYVRRGDSGVLQVTRLGRQVCEFLTGAFPDLFDYGFTAELEKQLDDLAAGRAMPEVALRGFWTK